MFLAILFMVVSLTTLNAQNVPFSVPEGFPRVEVLGHTDNPNGYYFLNTFNL